MRYRGQTPNNHCDGESTARPNFIHHPAGQQQPDRVSQLKTKNDRGVNPFVLPLEFLDQGRLEKADELTVDVIDGGGEKEKSADDPAVITDATRLAGLVRCHRTT